MTAIETRNFKQELKTDFIPAIEKMIEKEKNHLAFLLSAEKKLEGLPLIGNMLMNRYAKFNDYCTKEIIQRSERSLKMLELRLADYKKYANS